LLAIKANLAKAMGAKLWVFQLKLMTAKPPNNNHYRFTFLRFSDFFFSTKTGPPLTDKIKLLEGIIWKIIDRLKT